MTVVRKLVALLFLLLVINACATFKAQYATPQKPLATKVNSPVEHTFWLIGDAGNSAKGSVHPTLTYLEEEIKNAPQKSTLIFLGDNVYEAGIPKENKKGYALAKHKIEVQTTLAKKFNGNTIFIPGNHDWYNGLKGLKREEKLVEEALGKNTFLPENGCPIEKVEISEDINLILVDSHWYVTNWDKHPTINDDCQIKTRDQFLEKYESYIKKSQGKTTLVALHHPMFTNGPHAGYYTAKSHLKPLPILGTMANILRTTTGISNADQHHKKYKEFKNRIVTLSQNNEKVVFISGHEHSLQYLKEFGIPQIVSGAGSKVSGTKLKTADFSYGDHGFAKLEVYKDGSSRVKFYSLSQKKVAFETEVWPPNELKTKLSELQNNAPFTKATIYTEEEVEKSNFYNFLWGERYRKYFGTAVNAPTVNLDTLLGGLTPVRKGGGHQSKSLRLKDPNGKEYVMRALRKSAVQYLQAVAFKEQYVKEKFEGTLTQRLLLDVFTGSHPYAPFIIGDLADAVGIYHTNPVLYYVPKQPALKGYNTSFGDELYMIEEHAGDNHGDKASFGFSNKAISTSDMLEKVHAEEDAFVDEKAYIRARLFDMLIGDFDRHEDQWRWLVFKENGNTIYRPLPRDRDQAFSIFGDGALLNYFTNAIPQLKPMVSYNEELKSPKWFNLAAYPLDMAIINESTKKDWDNEVTFIQQNLTHEVIEKAFEKLPKEVQDSTSTVIKNKLKGRRKNLQKIAEAYFLHLNAFQVIKGTNKDDWFDIERLKNGETKVSVYRIIKGKKTRRFHQQTYSYKNTNEIWIYGLDDDDVFEVFGEGDDYIRLRIIGGQNNDIYTIKNGKKVTLYDYKSKKNTFKTNKGTIKLTDDYQTNTYNYKKLKNSAFVWNPNVGFNPDDGLSVGVKNTWTYNGFDRNPFTNQHVLGGAYFLATNGFEFNYAGEFAHVFKKWNLGLNAAYTTPNYTRNFFGFGNYSSDPHANDTKDKNFNRVKIRKFSVGSSMHWRGFMGATIDWSVNYQSFKLDRTEGRFIAQQFAKNHPIFNDQTFLNTALTYRYANTDNASFPTLGMAFELTSGYTNNLKNKDAFGYVISSFSIDYRLVPSGQIVLASKVKGHLTLGDGYQFYQAASIGGNDGLRGFRNQRFTGKSAWYHSSDIRFLLRKVKTTLLPMNIGVYTGFDYGKVYTNDFLINPSFVTRWANVSYGGGVFFNAADLITGNLSVFDSDDGLRLAVTLGFAF